MPPDVLSWLRKANIVETTGWTPAILAAQPARDMRILETIWGARGSSSRQDRKMMKG